MSKAILTALAVALAAAAAGPAGQEIREDPPLATQPVRGIVSGTIGPAAKVRDLSAVSRVTGKRYQPARFDRQTGSFRFEELPGDASYDLCVATRDGARIEGIDLSWHEARLLRLVELRRKQLALPPPRPHVFTRADAEELLRYVKDLKDFTDVRRVLYLCGDGPRAVMLVEAMRVRDFYAKQADQLIWRTELWYFQYQYGGWERVANVERVLERERISAAKWRTITLVYYPQLSVYVDEQGRSQPVDFRIPEPLEPARGRIAGTEPAQATKPILLGIPEATGEPGS